MLSVEAVVRPNDKPSAERWRSGLTYRFRKPEYSQGYREFESLSLRQILDQSNQTHPNRDNEAVRANYPYKSP